MHIRQTRGFSLIELLVVIAIIGLLSSVVLAGLENARMRSRDARRLADIKQLENALELYHTENNAFPVPSCGADAWSDSSCWATLLPGNDISTMPTDPKQSDLGSCDTTPNCHLYHYCVTDNGNGYVLAVNLESAVNASSQPAPATCPTGGPNTFWVHT